MRTLIVIMGAALLAGCGGSDGASNDATAAASTPATEPAHNWTYREGDEYGYAAAVSEDQQKAGQGAGQVTMFRYLGQSGGVYTVASESDGGWLAYASCANPCQVIKLVGPGSIEHVVFNPNTIVGEALADAFNGQLEVYGDSAADRAEAAKASAAEAASAPPPPSSDGNESSATPPADSTQTTTDQGSSGTP
jgi:hypothetical protein